MDNLVLILFATLVRIHRNNRESWSLHYWHVSNHKLLPKSFKYYNGKFPFDQLTTISFSTPFKQKHNMNKPSIKQTLIKIMPFVLSRLTSVHQH